MQLLLLLSLGLSLLLLPWQGHAFPLPAARRRATRILRLYSYASSSSSFNNNIDNDKRIVEGQIQQAMEDQVPPPPPLPPKPPSTKPPPFYAKTTATSSAQQQTVAPVISTKTSVNKSNNEKAKVTKIAPRVEPTIKKKETVVTVITLAKDFVESDFGLLNADLLADAGDFSWMAPSLASPLDKVAYLAAGRFFNLRQAFRDLDYRAHDYRIDERDPQTVRCTIRPLGTMTGSLQLRKQLVPANGQLWKGPPEAISITFHPQTNKVTKLASGFCMDRYVGNTNGLCGVLAAAQVAGAPPPLWEAYPVPSLLAQVLPDKRKFPKDYLKKQKNKNVAPFPETVLIELAKGILTTGWASQDPDLLGEDFCFCTPTNSYTNKATFLQSQIAKEEFGDHPPAYSHVRVDPFDPYRVWVDVQVMGPDIEGPPQAISLSFDQEGFCTRMTAGAVMDPSIGTTGGLVGPAGIKYALGERDPVLATRPLPAALGQLQERLLSPLASKIESPLAMTPSAFARPKFKPTKSKSEPKDSNLEIPTTELAKAYASLLAESKDINKNVDANSVSVDEEARLRMQQVEEQVRLQIQQKIELEALQARQKAEREAIKQKEQEALLQAKKDDVIAEDPTIEEETEDVWTNSLLNMAAPVADRVAKTRGTDINNGQEKPKQPEKDSKDSLTIEATLDRIRNSFATIEIPTQGRSTVPIEESRKKQLEKMKLEKESAAKERKTYQEERRKKELILQKQAEERRLKAEANRSQVAKSRATKSLAVQQAIKQQELEAKNRRMMKQAKRKELLKENQKKVQDAWSAFQSKPYPFSPSKKMEKVPRKKPMKPLSVPPASMKGKRTPKRTVPFELPVLFEDTKQMKTVKSTKPVPLPKNIPIIAGWRRNLRGGISGTIFSSKDFEDGQRVDTSPVGTKDIKNDSRVNTDSGSEYFLTSRPVRELMKQQTRKSLPKKNSTQAPNVARATLQLTKAARAREETEMLDAIDDIKSKNVGASEGRMTFSLSAIFDMGKKKERERVNIQPQKVSVQQTAKKPDPTANLPSISKWRRNLDGSMTGFVRGATSFEDGERITTSPIRNKPDSKLKAGDIVVTSSGSKYVLV